MMIAEVVGPLVAPIQHPFYDGKTLLMVQPLEVNAESGSLEALSPTGDTLVAVDRVGAGEGERVLVLKEGSSARSLFAQESAPVRTVIVGIIDEIELDGRSVFFKGER